jgi:hypothetical protein
MQDTLKVISQSNKTSPYSLREFEVLDDEHWMYVLSSMYVWAEEGERASLK